jgi:hypothetical protein
VSNSKEAAEIQRQMIEVRSGLRHEAQGIYENARVLTDWKHYVRTYPWACVGVAAAVGFLVVPRRLDLITPDAATLTRLAEQNRLVVTPNPEAHVRDGLAGRLLSMIAGAAVRGAIGFAAQQAGEFFAKEDGSPDDSLED